MFCVIQFLKVFFWRMHDGKISMEIKTFLTVFELRIKSGEKSPLIYNKIVLLHIVKKYK